MCVELRIGPIIKYGVPRIIIYRELLKRIVEMFETGKAPVPIQETLEIVKFVEAALCSARNDGARALLA